MAYIAVFIGGILTSFTPCVYPVLPITIGVIGAQAAGKRSRAFILSVIYVLGIATTYAALGAFAALTGKLFGRSAASPIPYIIIGNICILLGLSRFGIINIPSFDFGSKARERGQRKMGFIGIYLVGLASGLIVGPCTAAVLGAILAFVATKQNIIFGVTLLFTFAIGMCILLVVLGTFTGLLSSLPRAGAWMEKIERFFGWALIIIGEYFLITAGKFLI